MNKTTLSVLLAIPAAVFVAQGAGAQSAPDNTKVNKEYAQSQTETADNQKENESDRDLTKRIRQSVIADKNLSTYAHNVKIVSVNGKVTLNGVVRSDQERKEVAKKAQQVAGKDHVVNELKVAPSQ